jgi:hypothetical protein
MNRMHKIRNYRPLQQKQDEGQVDDGGRTVRLTEATNMLIKLQWNSRSMLLMMTL